MDAVTKFDLRKDAIVRAATGLLNQKGVKGMTLPLVASELSLAPRAVSYYFRRKEDLAAACFKRSVERMDEHIAQAHAAAADAPGKARAFVQLFFEGQRQVQLGMREPIAWFEDMRTAHDPEIGEAFVNMFRRVRDIFSAPGSPAMEPLERNARAHLLMSQMFWAVLWLPRYNPEDYTRMGERAADVLLNGMAAPGAAWRTAALPGAAPDESSGPDFLKAATELINGEGYLGASVAKISARLNVTKGSFYHHNEAKDDLVEQCFERTRAILRQTQGAADAATSGGLMNLASQAITLIGGQVSGQQPLLRTSALAAVPAEMRPRFIAGFERITNRYASVVSDGMGDGSIRAVDAPLAAQLVAGAINAGAELPYWAPGLTRQGAESSYVRPLFLGLFCPTA